MGKHRKVRARQCGSNPSHTYNNPIPLDDSHYPFRKPIAICKYPSCTFTLNTIKEFDTRLCSMHFKEYKRFINSYEY